MFLFFLKEIQFIIKKDTNINNSFFALYNNNEEEEENALIKNENIIIAKKKKKHYLFRKKINTISTIIIILVCCLVIIIIEYIKYNYSSDNIILKKEYILSKINTKLSLETLNRNGKYILFFDHYSNIYINSNDAYPIFDYYRRKGRNEAYYFLLNNSQLYYKLKKENNLDNIIIVDLNKKN